MTVEQLMIQRYKVIAGYPLSHMYFKVGAVLTWDGQCFIEGEYVRMAKETVESFPHLFKKLEWWDERKIHEMPEYVKGGSGIIYFITDYRFAKNVIVANGCQFTLTLFLTTSTPSTKEEYEAQKLVNA